MELHGTELQRSVLGDRQGVVGSCPGVNGALCPPVRVQDRVHELQPVAPSVLAVAFPFVSMKHACGLARPAEHIIGCWFSALVGSVALQCVIHNQFT